MPDEKSKPKKTTKTLTPRLAKPGHALVLRTCKADLTSYGGFQWPASGPVECPDWKPVAQCSNGLFGLLDATGRGQLLDWSDDAKWLVVEVAESDIVKVDGGEKVKFPRGEVLFSGDRDGALAWFTHLDEHKVEMGACGASPRVKGQASASGYKSQASASGYNGQASASGYKSQASASGDYGQASASGYKSQASASGVNGQASASGEKGISAAFGYGGRVQASETGAMVATWWDSVAQRPRLTVAYPGENGIKAGQWYGLNDKGEFVEVPA